MVQVFLKKGMGERIIQGHPWVFKNEVERIEGEYSPGELGDVFTQKKIFVGKGLVNPNSQILVRIISRNRSQIIDGAFFLDRINTAWQYRRKLGYTENCRVVFGEGDGLSGLIIDKFNDYLVLQTLSLGMDQWKNEIVAALNQIFQPRGIYERNDVPVRELEGMSQQKGFLSPPFATQIRIRENGLHFQVDIAEGQKTGYFLDQQDNRRQIKHLVQDADVLEAFCYTGSFSCHAASYGARSVLGLDISETAVEGARLNARLNGVEQICSFQTANAFDQLKIWSQEKRKFDVLILDPPAFTKSRGNIDKALAGYKEINLRAMKLLQPGGFLVTASCTHLVNPADFLGMVQAASRDARRSFRQVTFQTQSPDHPIIWNIETTTYLNFLILEMS
ncbi:MAG: class I SAM-dependent rRNA methyltransferase [Chitinophagaceae bacterium]